MRNGQAGYAVDRFFYVLIWFARLSVFAMMVTLALMLDSASTRTFEAGVRQKWQNTVDQVSLNLQAEILQNIQTVWGLAANVAVEPDISGERFNELASVIFRLAPALRNIGLAPDLVIRYVYPLKGNEAAIGLDLARSSLPPAQLQALKDSRRAIFSGPIDLVQGGQGLAGRIPIFTQDSGEFWGVVSVILNLDELYESANLTELKQNSRFVLSLSVEASNAEAVFYGPEVTDWTDPVSSTLDMPGVSWTIFSEPADGWPSGPENPWLFRSALLLVAGVIIGAVFWLTNLMLRERLMQTRFWGLFELAPIGIGLFDATSGKLIRANPELQQRCNGQNISLDDFDQKFNANGESGSGPLDIRRQLKENLRIDNVETSFPTGDGAIAPVRIKGLELRNTGGEPVIWLITEDISEQKKIERMKNEFISTVSHELRTPLTSISGSLGLLANNAAGELPEGTEKLIGIAHRNSLQLAHLINDLLDIDKLVAGKVKLQIEPISVAPWLTESIENISQFASQNNVRLSLATPPEIQVNADRQRLDQALNNLLSNAIKFSPSGATVSVSAKQEDGLLRVYVRDEGEGVPDDFQQRIFEKFSQADSSSRRKKGGTGLGLAITRELMKQMGGTVDYESKPGKGATFWLELPVSGGDVGATD